MRGRWTLVELLVVVFILAILTSLVSAAVTTSLGKARQSSCFAHLRQLGLALGMYADEEDGFHVAAQAPAPADHWLNLVFVRYLEKRPELMLCPALTPSRTFNPFGGDGPYGDLRKAGYILNIIREDPDHGWSELGADISTPYPEAFGWSSGTAMDPVRWGNVLRPAERIDAVDSAPDLLNTANGIGIIRLTETDHGPVDPNCNQEVNSGERKVTKLHGGNFNALWGDAHVENRRQTEHEEWNVYRRPRP